MRVYELAKEFGTRSKELIATLNGLGIHVRSASSTLHPSQVQRVKAALANARPKPPRDVAGKRRQSGPARRGAQRPPQPAAASERRAVGVVPSTAGGDVDPLNELIVDVVMQLHRCDVDAIEIWHPADSTFKLRVDKVEDVQQPFWLSTWLTIAAGNSMPASPIPWMTLTNWRLPLVPLLPSDTQLDALGVVRLADVIAVDNALRIVIAGRHGEGDQPRLAVEECGPAEANRRFIALDLVRRRRIAAAPRGIAVGTCLRCGLPLSDPESVRFGLGRECRVKLGKDVLRALARPKSIPHATIGAREQRAWARLIEERFSDLAGDRS